MSTPRPKSSEAPSAASAQNDPLVAVVVLTWNGRDDTLECLRSLAQSRWSRREVIVVDNASTDGTVGAVRTEFPHSHLIENEANLGFAGGNNVGIAYALEELQADYVLLLNNDTLIAPDAIEELVRAASNRNVGAACPLIYFQGSKDLVWYAGASFDPVKGRSGRMYGYRQAAGRFDKEVIDVQRAAGAAMLVPRAAVDQVGMLDEALFYLYEDVEWSLRLRNHGFRVVLMPSAHVWHKVASSQGGSEHTPTTAYYGTRNHLEVCRRFAPLPPHRSTWRLLVALAAHFLEMRHTQDKLAWVRGVWAGYRDFRRGHLGPRGEHRNAKLSSGKPARDHSILPLGVKPPDYYSKPREDLVAQLPRPIGRVLDIGCGAGAVGVGLRRAGATELTGVEIDPTAAAAARETYDTVLDSDVDTALDDLDGGARFDTIVCYDVLEHLYDPATVLRRLRALCVPGGYLHISIPNARHASLFRDLVFRGTFGYTTWGHRDVTHIRWFTRQDIVALLAECGWSVDRVSTHSLKPGRQLLVTLTAGKAREFFAVQWFVLSHA